MWLLHFKQPFMTNVRSYGAALEHLLWVFQHVDSDVEEHGKTIQSHPWANNDFGMHTIEEHLWIEPPKSNQATILAGLYTVDTKISQRPCCYLKIKLISIYIHYMLSITQLANSKTNIYFSEYLSIRTATSSLFNLKNYWQKFLLSKLKYILLSHSAVGETIFRGKL